MANNEKLLPCPFCGEKESLRAEHLKGTVRHPAYRVRCNNCGASSRYTDKDHCEAWNTRAAQPVATEAPYYPSLAIAMDAAMGMHEIDYPAVDAQPVAVDTDSCPSCGQCNHRSVCNVCGDEWSVEQISQPVAVEGMPEPVAVIGDGYQLLWYSPVGMETLSQACARTGLEVGDKLARIDACAPAFAELTALRGENEQLKARISKRLIDLTNMRHERDTLSADKAMLVADLAEAAAQLRKYEVLHRAKWTADSTAKAEVNAALAARFEATIAKATKEVPQ